MIGTPPAAPRSSSPVAALRPICDHAAASPTRYTNAKVYKFLDAVELGGVAREIRPWMGPVKPGMSPLKSWMGPVKPGLGLLRPVMNPFRHEMGPSIMNWALSIMKLALSVPTGTTFPSLYKYFL